MKENNLNIQNPILKIKDLSIAYIQDKYAVKNVNAEIERNANQTLGGGSCSLGTCRHHKRRADICVVGDAVIQGKTKSGAK